MGECWRIDLRQCVAPWQGGLPPFGRVTVVKPEHAVYQIKLWGCFATQRGQAPSPQLTAQMG
jgi:hypothetical protein